MIISRRQRLAVAAIVGLAWAMVYPGRAVAQSSTGTPMMSTTTQGSPDTLFRVVRARLTRLKYRFDEADDELRRLLVRAPGDSIAVEVRVLPANDSATLTITPRTKDLAAAMGSAILVMRDAKRDPESPKTVQPTPPGELGPSDMRPALFVSPRGRLWDARTGLFTTDSLFGPWTMMLRGNALVVGTVMTFVDEDTLLLGLPDAIGKETPPRLFRTTTAGRRWFPIPVKDLRNVKGLAAIGGSVWVMGTWFDGAARRATFLKTADGGTSWVHAPLPDSLNGVTDLYRVDPSTAYVATAAYDGKGPAFWRTVDAGATWVPLPTPRDQQVNDVPANGTRIERIATIGDWLVVREYGKVFVTRADTVRWQPLKTIVDFAPDRERGQLFALTGSAHLALVDSQLAIIWQSQESIPRVEDIEMLLARNGIGYVSMGNGDIYELREGQVRVRHALR